MYYPDWTKPKSLLNTHYNASVIIPDNGFALIYSMSNTGFVYIGINGYHVADSGSNAYPHHDWDFNFIPVKKGDVITSEFYYENVPTQASATVLFLPVKH